MVTFPVASNALDLILVAEMKHRVIGLQRSVFAAQMRVVEHDLARIVGDDAVVGLDDGCVCAVEHHMNLRRQGQRIALARVLHADGPACGLRRSEFDAGLGRGVSALLVKDQIARLQVDGILEFFRRGLIGTRQGPPDWRQDRSARRPWQ